MASRFINPFIDVGSGITPSSGAKLNFYTAGAGSVTPKDTYTDAGAGTTNANPVIADSLGVFPEIFISGEYRVVLTDSNDVQKRELDNVSNADSDGVAANAAAISALEVSVAAINAPAIDGLIPSNAADADHDITISSGTCSDSTGTSVFKLLGGITKRIDEPFVAGDNFGGMFTGSVASDTTYHYFIIEKDADGTIDAGYDTSVSAANMPSGYTKFRLLFSFKTDSSSNVKPFTAFSGGGGALQVDLTDREVILGTLTPGTSAVTLATGAPIGVQVKASLATHLEATGSGAYVLFSALHQTDAAPTNTLCDLATRSTGGSDSNRIDIMTDTSAQVRYRSTLGSVLVLAASLNGWTQVR